jgi:hypothetical protein
MSTTFYEHSFSTSPCGYIEEDCLTMSVRGPKPTTLAFNPYFQVFVLQSWATRLRFHLPRDICERILGFCRWEPTTCAEMIRAVAHHVGDTPERVHLVLGGKLIGLGEEVTTIPSRVFFTRFDPVEHNGPFKKLFCFGECAHHFRNPGRFSDPHLYEIAMDEPYRRILYEWCHRNQISPSQVRFQRIVPFELVDVDETNRPDDSPWGLQLRVKY